MNAKDIIDEARRSGISLSVQGGEIRYKGPREAVDRIIPDLRAHKPELLEMLSATVTVQTTTAQCDVAVDRSRVIDFMAEARRRGVIVKYRLQGQEGFGVDSAAPGETAADLRGRLDREFGERLEVEP